MIAPSMSILTITLKSNTRTSLGWVQKVQAIFEEDNTSFMVDAWVLHPHVVRRDKIAPTVSNF